MPQAFQPRDPGSFLLRVGFDGLQNTEIPTLAARILFAFGTDNENGVARMKLRVGSAEEKFLPIENDFLFLRRLRLNRVPFNTCVDLFNSLERLRFFVRTGNALNLRSNLERHFRRRARRFIKEKR